MLLVPAVYPFQPIQLTLISSLMIGFPGFVLALEPSEERIRGDFLRTVLLRALPGGVAAAFCAALSMAFFRLFGWPRELCSTLATLSAGVVCWMVLFRSCRPLNKIRKLLLIAVAAGFVGAYLLLGNIFFLVPLTGPAIGALAGLAVLGCGIILLCDYLIARHEAPAKAAKAAKS